MGRIWKDPGFGSIILINSQFWPPVASLSPKQPKVFICHAQMSLYSPVKGNFLVTQSCSTQQNWGAEWNTKQRKLDRRNWRRQKCISHWKWPEGQVWDQIFKGPHELTVFIGAAFQMSQEKALKLSEGKSCICAEIEMGNHGATIAEISWFPFFFRLSRVGHVEKQTHFWILVSSWKAYDSFLQPSFLLKASIRKL